VATEVIALYCKELFGSGLSSIFVILQSFS